MPESDVLDQGRAGRRAVVRHSSVPCVASVAVKKPMPPPTSTHAEGFESAGVVLMSRVKFGVPAAER